MTCINGMAFNFGLVFRLAGNACKTFLTSLASCLVIVASKRSGPKYSTRVFRYARFWPMVLPAHWRECSAMKSSTAAPKGDEAGAGGAGAMAVASS